MKTKKSKKASEASYQRKNSRLELTYSAMISIKNWKTDPP